MFSLLKKTEALKAPKDKDDSSSSNSSTITSTSKSKESRTLNRLASRLKFFAAQNVLHAVITFIRPKRTLDYWIPKGPYGWLDYMVEIVKKKTVITSLKHKELRQVVLNARIQVCQEFSKENQKDPDLPDCYFWSETEIGSWLDLSGFSYLKETFLRNNINGRRLIRVTPTFLLQIGLQDLYIRKNVLQSVRKLLGLPATTCTSITTASHENLRAILFEKFLWKRSVTGRLSDRLTFKVFCEQQGFTSDDLQV